MTTPHYTRYTILNMPSASAIGTREVSLGIVMVELTYEKIRDVIKISAPEYTLSDYADDFAGYYWGYKKGLEK